MDIPNIYQVILRIAAIFAVTELLIMIGFGYFFVNFSPFIETLIDVALLTLLATPLVYITVIRPHITRINQLFDVVKQICTLQLSHFFH